MCHDQLHAPARRLTRYAMLLAATSAVAACAGNTDAAGDSATAAAADSATLASAPAANDTGMGGMDHSNMAMGAMNRSAPRDSNQAFLRMMSDHHEGFVVMSDSAQPRLQSPTARSDAQRLRHKQDEEQNRMLAMLSQQYSDSVTPMIMPSNRAMIDSVVRAPQGAEADRVYYSQVIAHHREGIHHAEMLLPHLTGEVREMAERMRSGQQREIEEFERKMGQAGGS